MASKTLTLFGGIMFVLGIAVVADAGNCRQFFVQQYAAPVYAQPLVLYQAGLSTEQAAVDERVRRVVREEIRAALLQAQQQPQQRVEQAAQQTALGQHCAKCHSGAAPKGGVVIDGATAIECRTITAALRAISVDKMPKDHRLTPEEKGAVMQQLLDLEFEESLPPPAPEPTVGELK